jgi:hypothetical protein
MLWGLDVLVASSLPYIVLVRAGQPRRRCGTLGVKVGQLARSSAPRAGLAQLPGEVVAPDRGAAARLIVTELMSEASSSSRSR